MKRTALTFVLYVASVSAVIAFELRPHPAAAPVTAAAPRPVAAPSPTQTEARIPAWVETALARPLFSATRRSPAEVQVEAAHVPDTVPRLTAIVIDGSRRTAIFAPERDKKPIVTAEGDSIGGLRIVRVEPSTVTLRGPGVQQVLRPTGEPNGAAPAAPAPPPPPSTALDGPPGLDRMPPLVSDRGPNLVGIPGLPP